MIDDQTTPTTEEVKDDSSLPDTNEGGEVSEIKSIEDVQKDIHKAVEESISKDYVKRSEVVSLIKDIVNKVNKNSVKITTKPLEVPKDKSPEEEGKIFADSIFDI